MGNAGVRGPARVRVAASGGRFASLEVAFSSAVYRILQLAAAAGLVGLGVYQISQGQFETGVQSFLGALTAAGLRHAIAKQPG